MATVVLKPGAYTVRAAHTSNVASRSGTGTFGGAALVAGQIVLLTAQSTASENGPYIIRAGAWDRIAHPGGTLRAGENWYIEAGTYAGKTYQVTTDNPIVLGTTNLTVALWAGGLLDLPAAVREVRVELYISGVLPGVTAVYAAPGTVAQGMAAACRVFSPIQPGLGTPPSWTLTGLYAELDTAPGGADTLVVTVMKSTGGGAYANTTATCTITGAGKTASDEAHNPTFTSGDWAAVKVQGGGSAADLHITLVFLRTV